MKCIHPKQLQEVAFLSCDVQTQEGLVRKEIGTCFFTHVRLNERWLVGYVVTAKHVVEKAGDRPIFVRVNRPGGGVRYVPVRLPWHFPDDESVDLAVACWGDPDGEYGTDERDWLRSFSLELVVEEMVKRMKTNLPWPPSIGTEIVMIGLLTHQPGIERNTPVVRFGHMALTTKEKLVGHYGRSNYHLIDLQTYPGHSGAPVYFGEGDNIFLLGVMSGGYPTDIGDAVRKSDRWPGSPDRVFNLGISTVVPVDEIVELVMSDKLKKEREQFIESAEKRRDEVGFESTSVGESKEETFTKADFESALKKVSRKLSDEEKSET